MPSIEEKKATGGPKLYVSDHLSTSSLIIILPFLPLFLSQLCNHGNLLLKTLFKVWAPGGSQGQGEDMSPTPDIWAALTRIIEESMKTFCHEYGYFATGSLSNIQNVYLSVVPHLHNSTFFHSQDFGLTGCTQKSLPKASLMTHLICQPLCALGIKKTDVL